MGYAVAMADSASASRGPGLGEGTMTEIAISPLPSTLETGGSLLDLEARLEAPLSDFLRTLIDDPDGDTVATAVRRSLLGQFGCHMLSIYVVSPDETLFTLEGSSGLDPDSIELYATFPADIELPGPVAYRTGTPVFTSVARVSEDYPLTDPYARGRSIEAEIAMVPLRFAGGPIGFLGSEFTSSVEKSWELRGALGLATSAVSLWAALRQARQQGQPAPAPRRLDRALVITERQRQIIALVREGRTNTQIARRLGFSVSTVKADLVSLTSAFGAHGRQDLAVRAARAGY